MFDSDTMMLTDNDLLVKTAEKNYKVFKVPTNMVSSRKVKRYYTADEKSDLDLKTSVNKIGDIINLSQELQTYMWHQLNNGATYDDIRELYYDACQLSVLSNLEIDKAKKEFDIDSVAELKKMKEKWTRRDESGRVIKPYFFGFLAKEKGYYNEEKKNYMHHDTSMDYLHEVMDEYRVPTLRFKTIELYEMLDYSGFNTNSAKTTQIQKIIEMIQEFRNYSSALWSTDSREIPEKYADYIQAKEQLISSINKIKMNKHTMLLLFKRLNKNKELRRYIVSILFNIGNNAAFELIKQSERTIPYLVEGSPSEFNLYGIPYQKCDNKIA